MVSEQVYRVTGMTCEHCEASVREEVELIAGVESVMADHATGRVVVLADGVDDGAVRSAVEAIGYGLESA